MWCRSNAPSPEDNPSTPRHVGYDIQSWSRACMVLWSVCIVAISAALPLSFTRELWRSLSDSLPLRSQCGYGWLASFMTPNCFFLFFLCWDEQLGEWRRTLQSQACRRTMLLVQHLRCLCFMTLRLYSRPRTLVSGGGDSWGSLFVHFTLCMAPSGLYCMSNISLIRFGNFQQPNVFVHQQQPDTIKLLKIQVFLSLVVRYQGAHNCCFIISLLYSFAVASIASMGLKCQYMGVHNKQCV